MLAPAAHSYAGLCTAGRPRKQTKTFWTTSVSKKMIRTHSTFYILQDGNETVVFFTPFFKWRYGPLLLTGFWAHFVHIPALIFENHRLTDDLSYESTTSCTVGPRMSIPRAPYRTLLVHQPGLEMKNWGLKNRATWRSSWQFLFGWIDRWVDG